MSCVYMFDGKGICEQKIFTDKYIEDKILKIYSFLMFNII